MYMRTLDYYFGKDDDDGVVGLSPGPKSPRHQPTFNMVIGKRKQAVEKLHVPKDRQNWWIILLFRKSL